MSTDYKNIENVRNGVMKGASKGYKYFIKNVALVLLIVLGIFLITNPEVLFDPSMLFSHIKDGKGLISLLVLFFISGGIYQLSRSLQHETRITDVKSATVEFANEKKQEHKELMAYRMNMIPMVSNILKDIVIELECDRASILEMHNGTNNLSNVPFIYADMNFEEVSQESEYAGDEFQNFNLTKYPFFSEHYDEGIWQGPASKIEKEDKRLFGKIKSVDSEYVAGCVLEGIETPVGFLIVSFRESDISKDKQKEIYRVLNQSSQKLTKLLSGKA